MNHWLIGKSVLAGRRFPCQHYFVGIDAPTFSTKESFDEKNLTGCSRRLAQSKSLDDGPHGKTVSAVAQDPARKGAGGT
ncbi:MAG: hypothetical protein IPH08_16415 [Rhodocyclaceae bacterium]|nr:hypothetical protein [Rhodocyclaceae bacterium]MBK6908584.1 hypothetical protein [Rhodocyclaceae bacterium]